MVYKGVRAVSAEGYRIYTGDCNATAKGTAGTTNAAQGKEQG